MIPHHGCRLGAAFQDENGVGKVARLSIVDGALDIAAGPAAHQRQRAGQIAAFDTGHIIEGVQLQVILIPAFRFQAPAQGIQDQSLQRPGFQIVIILYQAALDVLQSQVVFAPLTVDAGDMIIPCLLFTSRPGGYEEGVVSRILPALIPQSQT